MEKDFYDTIDSSSIESLKKLTRINAPSSFESDLFQKIGSDKSNLNQKFWIKAFSSGFFLPAVGGLTVVLLFLLVMDFANNSFSNPFGDELQQRFDIISKEISSLENNNFEKPEKVTHFSSKIIKREKAIEPAMAGFYEKTNLSTENKVRKAYRVSDTLYAYQNTGTNYKLVYLTIEQKIELERVKERVLGYVL